MSRIGLGRSWMMHWVWRRRKWINRYSSSNSRISKHCKNSIKHNKMKTMNYWRNRNNWMTIHRVRTKRKRRHNHNHLIDMILFRKWTMKMRKTRANKNRLVWIELHAILKYELLRSKRTWCMHLKKVIDNSSDAQATATSVVLFIVP